MTDAWIVCLGRRTIGRVWETTARPADEDHSKAFRLSSEAVWNWDELGRVLLVELPTTFVPGCRLRLALDGERVRGRASPREVDAPIDDEDVVRLPTLLEANRLPEAAMQHPDANRGRRLREADAKDVRHLGPEARVDRLGE